MTRSEWYNKVQKFYVGKYQTHKKELPRRIFIEIRINTTNKWAITNDLGEVLNKSLHWEYEPNPSSRTDDFIKRTRFTLDEAQDICERIFIRM